MAIADARPTRSHEAGDCELDPRIRLHFEYFRSILENLSCSDRLADAQNRADRIIDACRKSATRGVPRKSLDLSVEFPSARRLWRVAPSDGTGLAMMAHGSVGTGRAGAALGRCLRRDSAPPYHFGGRPNRRPASYAYHTIRILRVLPVLKYTEYTKLYHATAIAVTQTPGLGPQTIQSGACYRYLCSSSLT